MNGQRVSQTYRGTKRDAQKELRRLIRSSDTGEAVLPDKLTLGQWIKQWLAMGAPGRKRQAVGKRSLERYSGHLLCHVVPSLGERPLQQLRATEIGKLYVALQDKGLAKATIHATHVTLSSCLRAATIGAGKILAISPMADLSVKPDAGESDHGIALDREQARKLIAGFQGHPLYLLVVAALKTGARRNELLALQWSDLDATGKTLTIRRALERVDGASGMKAPKTARGVRTITIDAELIELLLVERERHLRIAAGVPDGVAVNLGLIKLPDSALIFPGSPVDGFSFTTPRNPSTLTSTFRKVAKRLGFPTLRFHDLRGTAITRMLNKGVPLHVVAKRHGHDPAIMLRSYAKHLKGDDAEAAQIMSDELKGVL
jgi:integrase